VLDEQLTEQILSKLALTYGVRFHAVYEGMDAAMVRRNWAKELDGVSREGVLYAMANLPERFPPNVLEFRRLCQSRRTEAERLRLPPPKPQGMSADVAREVERIRRAQRNTDPRAWARELRRRELACENLTNAQRDAWRAALREPNPPQEAAE
jgi:AcrR family transcriptional regulator